MPDSLNTQNPETPEAPKFLTLEPNQNEPPEKTPAASDVTSARPPPDDHQSLKYHLLGQSATKAGLALDQSKISEIIYEASKGSKFFQREEQKDKLLTEKIAALKIKADSLPAPLLVKSLRDADSLLLSLEAERNLSQHIIHVDCDAFFAAVEELDRPELKDVPFAVGKGVLTTANYHARKFGCRSGMASFVAKRLCPQLILISNNFQKYSAKAEEVREILVEYDSRFESASIDEAYLNITSYCDEHSLTPEDVVASMRASIAEKTKITVSAGIAANARIAKICSNINKPNGQFTVPRERAAIMSFIGSLPTRKVNGIGRVLERELAGAINVYTVADLYEKRAYLAPIFGDKTAHFLLKVYLGLGRTHIQPAQEYERKSVGTERTFADLSNPDLQKQQLRATAEALEKDLAKREVKGRTLVLKVKLHTYEVLTRQVIATRALSTADELYNHALPILTRLQIEIPWMSLRLMGLRCTNIVSTKKPDTLAFFGFKGHREEGAAVPRAMILNDEEWEQWPEEELGSLEPAVETMSKEKEGSKCTDSRGQSPFEELLWDCPICLLPQRPDERKFNEHIDLCLSRQTIREVVQESEANSGLQRRTSDGNRSTQQGEKKRGRSATAADPKQKKLCFG